MANAKDNDSLAKMLWDVNAIQRDDSAIEVYAGAPLLHGAAGAKDGDPLAAAKAQAGLLALGSQNRVQQLWGHNLFIRWVLASSPATFSPCDL